MNNTLIKTVSFSDFCDSFSDTYKNNFTYEGKRALYDYLCNMAEEQGESIELDTVSLCCDFTEYENMEALQQDYPDAKSMEDVENETQVIKVGDGDAFIIQQY